MTKSELIQRIAQTQSQDRNASIASGEIRPLLQAGKGSARTFEPRASFDSGQSVAPSIDKVGLPAEICAHSFRGKRSTEYLRNGGDLRAAARTVGHESTRSTQLDNRLREQTSLDEMQRSTSERGDACGARESQSKGRWHETQLDCPETRKGVPNSARHAN